MPFFLKARLNRLVKGVPQGYGLYLVINRKVCCMDRIYYIYMLYIYDICIECTWISFGITPIFVLQCCFFLVPDVLHVSTVLDPQIEYEFNYFRYLNFGPQTPKQKPSGTSTCS